MSTRLKVARQGAPRTDPITGSAGWRLEESGLHLSFRPSTYLTPMSFSQNALRTVKGAERRRLITSGTNDIPAALLEPSLSQELTGALGTLHPALLGREFLPNRSRQEVEIARITLQSVTQDVLSVYASQGRNRIRYRLVDEYGGDTLRGRNRRSSVRPLSLEELARFIFGRWNMAQVLAINFSQPDDTLEEALDFVEGESAYYEELAPLVSQAIEAWWKLARVEWAA